MSVCVCVRDEILEIGLHKLCALRIRIHFRTLESDKEKCASAFAGIERDDKLLLVNFKSYYRSLPNIVTR